MSLNQKTGATDRGSGNFESTSPSTPPLATSRRARKKPVSAPKLSNTESSRRQFAASTEGSVAPASHPATTRRIQQSLSVPDKPNKGNRKRSYHNTSVHSSPEPCAPPPKPPDDFHSRNGPPEKDPTQIANNRHNAGARGGISPPSTSKPVSPRLGPQRELVAGGSLDPAKNILSPKGPKTDQQSRLNLLDPLVYQDGAAPSLASSSTLVNGNETTILAPPSASGLHWHPHGGGVEKSQSKLPSKRNRSKRKAPGHPDERETRDEFQGPKMASQASANGDSVTVRFACPWYRIDPLLYPDCAKLDLDGAARVKQHLLRGHRRPIHCPKCGAEFPLEQPRDEHIRSSTCRKLTFKKTGLSQDQINDIQHTRAANQKTTWIEMFNICCRDRQTPAPAPTNEVIFIRTPWPVDFVASILPKFLELEMDPTLDQLMATANSSDDRKVAFRNIIESLLLQRVPTYLEDNLGQSRRRTRQAQALMAQDGQGAPPVVFGYSHVHPKSGFVQDPPRMAGGSSTHVVGLRSPMMVNGYGDFPVDGGGHSMQFADFPPMNNSTALPFGWNPHAFSPTNPIAHPAAQNGLATMASSPSAPLHDTLSQCPWQYNPNLAFSKNSQGPMSPNAVYNTDLSQGLPANTHQPALHYGMAASSPVSKSNQQYPLGPRHFGNPL